MKDNIKISIIIPCYNEEKTLNQIIEKVLKFKTYDKEIIIVDDCSSDNTQNIINELKKNLSILGSAHNQKEIREKISQKCRAIFLSPIFYAEKSINFLNVYKFNSL